MENEISTEMAHELIERFMLDYKKKISKQYEEITEPISPELIEHMKYLKEKGIYDIEFHENYIIGRHDCNSPVYFKICRTKNDTKKLYHGTTIKFAKEIIKEGYLKGVKCKDKIEYNKVFFSQDEFYFKPDGFPMATKSLYNPYREYITFEIEQEGHEIYSYIDGIEWIILGDIDITKANIYIIKEDKSMIKTSKEELLALPMQSHKLIDVFIHARREVWKKLKKNDSIDLYFINFYNAEDIKYLGNNKYIVDDIVEVSEQGKPKNIKRYVVELQVSENIYNITSVSITDKET